MAIFGRKLISTSYAAVKTFTKMKLDSPEFHRLFTPELRKLSELFSKNGFELRMAGGAVRDLLMGQKPADVDFATDATPTEMKDLFTNEAIRMLNKNGEEHGTITCRMNDKENFEITTLRIDVVCDGRRAAVKFTKNWEEDAFRRDLTINSLFLDLNGVVHDYTGGIEDIKRKRIAFVGDPKQRLQEDYLRILRYFRFYGRFAHLDADHEPGNISAIIECRDGLKNISGERIWMELHRILVGRRAASVIRTMLVDCQLGPLLALPSSRVDEFQRVSDANSPKGEDDLLAIEPSTAVSALFTSPEDADKFQLRCKCSNTERTLCELILEKREEAKERIEDLKYFKHLILEELFERGGELKDLVRHHYLELIKYIGGAQSAIFHQIEQWEIDKFPVGGVDLLNLAVPKGPRMRCTLRHLFNLWISSDLQMEKKELLEHINDPEISELKAQDLGKKKKKKILKRKILTIGEGNNGNV